METTMIYRFTNEDSIIEVDSNKAVYLNGSIIGILVSDISFFANLLEESGILLIAPYNQIPLMIFSAN